MNEATGVDPDRDPTRGDGPTSWQRLDEEIGQREHGGWLSTLRADQRGRWGRGERAGAELYFERFPAVADDAELAVDLIYSEALLRAALGERPTAQEYAARFPRHADELRRQFLLFEAIHAPPPTAAPASAALDPASASTDTGGAVPPLPGSAWPLVPGYEILGELGHGGMGIVYQARETGLPRLVALKMIAEGAQAGREQRARFRAEAEAVARLKHPHIVEIHHVGEYRGSPYMALEYADGGSLADLLRGGTLVPRQAAELVRTLADAVEAAHRAGIVHRDLKPGNILLQKKSTTDSTDNTDKNKNNLSSSVLSVLSVVDYLPKITDFGLAKLLDNDDGMTETGAVLGTPNYMAPEQAGAPGAAVGTAADVWALGAVLYECLTGRPPFKGATRWETLTQVREQDPVAPHLLQPRVPRDLETVCLRCLHKEPERRYASALELADELGRFLAGEPVRTRRPGALERAVRWARRRPAQAALLVAGLLLAVLLGPGSFWLLSERQAKESARAETELADRLHKAEVEQAEYNARMQRYHVLLARVHQRNVTTPLGWTWESLKDIREAAALPGLEGVRSQEELASAAAACVGGVDVRQTRVLAEDFPAASMAFSPDAKVLAVGQFKVHGPRTTATLLLVDPRTAKAHEDNPVALSFVPGGAVLMSASDHQDDQTAKLWDVASGRLLCAVPSASGKPSPPP